MTERDTSAYKLENEYVGIIRRRMCLYIKDKPE